MFWEAGIKFWIVSIYAYVRHLFKHVRHEDLTQIRDSSWDLK